MYSKKFSLDLQLALLLSLLMLGFAGSAGAADFKVLLAFDGSNGALPRWQTLTFDSSGNLYGASAGGSWYYGGVVYKLVPNPDGTWVQSILTSFDGGLDGWDVYSGVVFDNAGNLYGETGSGGPLPGGCGFYTSNGCGTVYKLAPNPDGSWARTFVHTFEGRSDGRAPGHGLVSDAAGNFYGTTESDGLCDGAISRDNKCGTVFQLTSNPDGSWTHEVIDYFPKTGTFPQGGLAIDAAGAMYGTTEWGGGLGSCDNNSCGTVFKLAPNPDGTWAETVLHRFGNALDGSRPIGGVIFDSDGNLYGTTYSGGDTACDCGTVFRLTPNPDGSWTEHVLLRFAGGGLGKNPSAGLAMDSAGNLYGTAYSGGAHGYGTVFKLRPNVDGTWTKSVLHAFSGGWDGSNPWSKLILDPAGDLYGTASTGGRGRNGVVFEIVP
jgi:uncharacterized repeat protein (TIGR03803 family)